MKKILKILLKSVVGLVVFLVVYAIIVCITSVISVNAVSPETKIIPVYILTNGVHTDIVLPLKNDLKDWSSQISYHDTKAQDASKHNLAFGWGDKGFYLDTPTWADLKASTALKAATGLSTSAMHVTFYGNLKENETCKRFFVTEAQYKKMVTYIENSFELSNDQQIQRIGAHSYGIHDIFYEAKGSYSLFYTCNTWANQVLKAGEQKAALWTVFDKGIFYHYE